MTCFFFFLPFWRLFFSLFSFFLGLTEEQIIHIFSQAGHVLNFRLVYDRETGRPKGFGFAEYQDADSAASAVRNLNDYETMGRKLRVDFSHDGGDDEGGGFSKQQQQQQQQPPPPPSSSSSTAAAAPSSSLAPPQPPQVANGTAPLLLPPAPTPAAAPPAMPQHNAQQPPQSATIGGGGGGGSGGGGLPPLPPGVDLPPGVTCTDAISRTLSTLPSTQLLDIISQMKGLVMADPAKATELLTQAPQLSFAIFQALLLLGLVDSTALQSVVEQTAAQTAAAAAAAQQQQQLQHQQHQQQLPVSVTPVPAPPPPPPSLPSLPTQMPSVAAPSFAQVPDFSQLPIAAAAAAATPAITAQQAYVPPPPTVPLPLVQPTPQALPVQQVPAAAIPAPPPAAAAVTPALVTAANPAAVAAAATATAAAAAAPQQPVDIERATLFRYVLSLTPEQLNAMQPHDRDQILGVRQQIMSGALRL